MGWAFKVAYLGREYHGRSRQPGQRTVEDENPLDAWLRRMGLVAVDHYFTRNLCAVLAVGLCRLQYRVTASLASVAYLT